MRPLSVRMSGLKKNELLVHINHSHSSHPDILKDNTTYSYSYIYCIVYHSIHQWRMLIYITIVNGSNNTVWGSGYSAHKAVGRFAEHDIYMVSCVHRKCQTRAGVSEDINKLFECVKDLI